MPTLSPAGRLALVPLALAFALAACQPEAPAGPPDGWEASDDGARWWRPGTDTSLAFRDLTSLATMGVDTTESAFVGYVKGKLLELYRTDPETVDSVFTAEYLPRVREGVPGGDGYNAGVDRLVNEIRRDFYQRYNHTRKLPGVPLDVPTDLQATSGEVVVQVYVDRANQPVAVEKLAGTGTPLDALVMRGAATGEYTDAWVRPKAGRSAGVEIPSWIRITQRFGS